MSMRIPLTNSFKIQQVVMQAKEKDWEVVKELFHRHIKLQQPFLNQKNIPGKYQCHLLYENVNPVGVLIFKKALNDSGCMKIKTFLTLNQASLQSEELLGYAYQKAKEYGASSLLMKRSDLPLSMIFFLSIILKKWKQQKEQSTSMKFYPFKREKEPEKK